MFSRLNGGGAVCKAESKALAWDAISHNINNLSAVEVKDEVVKLSDTSTLCSTADLIAHIFFRSSATNDVIVRLERIVWKTSLTIGGLRC